MRAKKPLTRERYLNQFSRAVRWRLPPQEAEEAIDDYRELVFQEERDASKLVEELGEPVQAAHLLTDVKTYQQWTTVFGILAFGLFLCAEWSWMGTTIIRFPWDWGSTDFVWRSWAVLVVDILLSLVWFRRYGGKCGPVPKKLLLALAAVFLLGCVGMGGMYWLLGSGRPLSILDANGFGQITWEFAMVREVLIDGGALLPFLGLLGLVLARCRDRRWLALFILCLTVSVTFSVLSEYSRSIDFADSDVLRFRPLIFRPVLPLAAVGLVGTGVALW